MPVRQISLLISNVASALNSLVDSILMVVACCILQQATTINAMIHSELAADELKSLKSVDIQHAVEVVDLVLEDDGGEAADRIAYHRNRLCAPIGFQPVLLQ